MILIFKFNIIANHHNGAAMNKKTAEFQRFISQSGLKSTRQRDAVAEVFFSTSGHISAEELYLKVAKAHPGIGLTTVYRTLKLLTEAGLAKERRFGDQGVYEKEDNQTHHDHLICTRCGKIIEFKEPVIEKLQEDVAARYGFIVMDHKMELYGLCKSCSAA
jgi:Fur family transcriptional regulator, ferric uptake regulator